MAISFTTTQVGAAPEYKKYVSSKIVKTDRYKDATLLDFSLSPSDASFVRLVRGAYITVNSTLYGKVFTGYITNDPALTYLGHVGNTPKWGYVYQATSDEYILNLKPIGILPTFTNVSMGYIIKQLAARLVPNTFDVTNVQDGPLVAQYTPDSTKKFQDIINEFEESASFRFYANDKKLYFVPQDSVSMGKVTIDGNNVHFTPARLDIRPASAGASIANDVTVVGSVEPQAYVTEYFVGTGLDAKFPLASGVFGFDTSVILDETFQNSSFDSSKWDVFDTASQWLQIGNGYLNVQGGSGNASFDVRLQSKSLIPLDGKLRLTHGDWRLTSGAGYICGLWTQTPNSFSTGCVYALYYGGGNVRPVISGVADDTQTMTISASNRYVIRTIATFTKTNRITQQYNYLTSAGVVDSYGGDSLADTVVWSTLISEINVSDGSIIQQVEFKNTTSLSSSDVYARYIPAASDTLNAAFTGITISVPVDASLETATKVPLSNPNFDSWVSLGNHTPDRWYTSTPSLVWSEASIVDSGYAVKLLGDGAADLYQLVNTTVVADTQYNIVARLRKSGSMTGSVVFSLTGTGVNHTFTVAVSSLSSTAFQYVVGSVTAGITSVPTDLVLKVAISGGAVGQAVYLDSIQLVSAFSAKLIGPNEMDGLDGVAPIATIVSQNAENKSSYLGTPQYNPGQSELVFFKDSTTLTSNVPPENQIIKLRYRSAGPSIGRAINRVSAATESVNWGDDGIRSVVRTDVVPTPRTSEECELAAASIVTENSRSQYEGTYEQWSEYLTQEPKAGAMVEFLNLSAMAPVSVEEINEVVTTIESEKPIERFNHRISFGRASASNKLLNKIGAPTIGLQRSAYQVSTTPVDVQSVAANAAYATDVVNPSLIGWTPTTVNIDTGEDLTASDLYFEVRYTDDGWGVDDGLNLIARTTSRTFVAPRNLRGRTYFIRKARKGNHILWSEDQTKVATYSGATAKNTELGPDGQTCTVSSATLAESGSITGSVSGLTGSTFTGSVSVLAPVGKLMRLSLGATNKNFTATGYWQRVSVTRSGSAPASMSLTYVGTGTCVTKTTKWSVEESDVETFYAKTAAVKYGPTSRYSSLVRVSFPWDDVVTVEGAVDPPVKPFAVSQIVTEYGENYVLEILLTLEAEIGTTIGYNTEVNFYTNSICTISETGWVSGPDAQGGDTVSIKSPLWPKSDDARYVRTRARGFNANGEVSIWQESASGAGSLITAATPPGEVIAPDQPLLTDWQIADPAGILGDYSSDAEHRPKVRLTPLMINLPAGSEFMTFWLYKGSTRPDNPGQWEYLRDTTILYDTGTWVDQPSTDQVWIVCATASKMSWNQKPTDTTPYKSINIAKWGRPPAITGVSLPTHDARMIDGVKWFYVTIPYTAPISDANYFYTVIDAAWVDPFAANDATVEEAWVPGVSKWERIKEIRDTGPWTSGPFKAYDGGRRYYRIYSVSYTDVRGAEPTDQAVYVLAPREPVQIGFDATVTTKASLGKGLSKDASTGAIITTDFTTLQNNGFELDFDAWSQYGAGWSIDTVNMFSGSKCLKCNITGSNPDGPRVFQEFAVTPGKTYRFSVYSKGTTGVLNINIVAYRTAAAGGGFTISQSVDCGSASYSLKSITYTIPDNHYTMWIGFVSLNTVGTVYVDNATFEEVTAVAAGTHNPVTSYVLVGPSYNSQGIPSWYLHCAWTAEPVTASRASLYFEYDQTSPDLTPRFLGLCSIDTGAIDLTKQPYDPTSVSGNFNVYVVSKDGVKVLVYQVAITVPAAPANTLNLAQASAASLLGLKVVGTQLMPDVTTDFVIDSGTGKLTQNAVDLAKSYGFDTAELEKAPITNALRIKNLAVNKLIAGTALFAGDVVFARNNGFGIADSSVTINNNGVVIQKFTSGVLDAIVTIANTGITITKGASQVKVEAAGVTITNGILTSPNISVIGSTFTTTINSTVGFKATFTGGSYSGQSVIIQAGGVVVEKSSWQGARLSAPFSGTGGRLELTIDDITPVLLVISDSSSNRITSSRAGSFIDFTGLGSYIKADHFRFPTFVNGTKTPIGGGTPVTGWFAEICDPFGSFYYALMYT